jgi:hypothetical protein
MRVYVDVWQSKIQNKDGQLKLDDDRTPVVRFWCSFLRLDLKVNDCPLYMGAIFHSDQPINQSASTAGPCTRNYNVASLFDLLVGSSRAPRFDKAQIACRRWRIVDLS